MIARHLELKEHSEEKGIIKFKEELVKLSESYAREICSQEEKLEKAKDKCSANEKEWKAKEKKFKEHKDFYATEVAELKDLLKAMT